MTANANDPKYIHVPSTSPWRTDRSPVSEEVLNWQNESSLFQPKSILDSAADSKTTIPLPNEMPLPSRMVVQVKGLSNSEGKPSSCPRERTQYRACKIYFCPPPRVTT
ncbi:MAG: hypothetical protein VYA34_08505 [Myxococcota bacterium]|nr:hypothetical protein [Myxococcota bacterium]